MIIECSSCHSRYQYDEDRFERKPSKKIKCAKCGAVFEIFNPAFAKPAPPPIEAGDTTFASKRDAKATLHVPKPKPKTKPDTTETSPLPPGTGKKATDPVLPEGKRLSLAVISGPDGGSVFRIDKPRVTIGRANADITLNDSECSRQHAAIEVREYITFLEDLNSTNGTMVDGERINRPTELHDKSEFQVGASTLMLIVTEDA